MPHHHHQSTLVESISSPSIILTSPYLHLQVTALHTTVTNWSNSIDAGLGSLKMIMDSTLPKPFDMTENGAMVSEPPHSPLASSLPCSLSHSHDREWRHGARAPAIYCSLDPDEEGIGISAPPPLSGPSWNPPRIFPPLRPLAFPPFLTYKPLSHPFLSNSSLLSSLRSGTTRTTRLATLSPRPTSLRPPSPCA
jgi:hypothetical protein